MTTQPPTLWLMDCAMWICQDCWQANADAIAPNPLPDYMHKCFKYDPARDGNPAEAACLECDRTP